MFAVVGWLGMGAAACLSCCYFGAASVPCGDGCSGCAADACCCRSVVRPAAADRAFEQRGRRANSPTRRRAAASQPGMALPARSICCRVCVRPGGGVAGRTGTKIGATRRGPVRQWKRRQHADYALRPCGCCPLKAALGAPREPSSCGRVAARQAFCCEAGDGRQMTSSLPICWHRRRVAGRNRWPHGPGRRWARREPDQFVAAGATQDRFPFEHVKESPFWLITETTGLRPWASPARGATADGR